MVGRDFARLRLGVGAAEEAAGLREHVLDEFDAWRATGGAADNLTLAGAGEPTLHAGFGEVLDGLRARSAIPTVLMSNGSLFYLPAVRAAAAPWRAT